MKENSASLKTISFNTGALYSAHGQPISAAISADRSKICFRDGARCIMGIIEGKNLTLDQRTVMKFYNSNEYRFTRSTPEEMALIKVAEEAAETAFQAAIKERAK